MPHVRKSLSVLSVIVIVSVLFFTMIMSSCLLFSEDDDNSIAPPDNAGEDLLMDATFRIDIETIDVVFDFFPETLQVNGDAYLTFRMRKNQTKPLIHFNPALRNIPPSLIVLDGEELVFSDPEDVSIVSFTGTNQRALEFQRQLSPEIVHTLHMTWSRVLSYNYPMLYTDANDIAGRGNEELFPTINVPQELARHTITFRVHSETPYRIIGSGNVTSQGSSSGFQQWLLDTEQEISSYTLMFVLMPAVDVDYHEQIVTGVPVRIMSFAGEVDPQEAFTQLGEWLPELEERLGPFPMARGVSIFLTADGGGMEYFGGTISSLWALNHEVFHMYYGCSTVAKTYRDSWWDEAIDVWYESSVNPNFPAIDDSYRSDIVSGRSPIALGFDTRAYYEGARIIQAVSNRIGGRDRMISFLSHVHRTYSFSPFNTYDFLYYLQRFSDLDMNAEFNQWLFSDEQSQSLPHAESRHVRERADMTPPAWVFDRYR